MLSWVAYTVEELSTSVTPRLFQLHSWNRLNRQPIEHTLTQVAITTTAATKTTTITITQTTTITITTRTTTTITTVIIIIVIVVTKIGLMENEVYLTDLELRVTVVTRLQAGWSRVQIPLQEKFFSSQNVQTRSGAHPANYSMGISVLSRGAVDYPPPPTAKMKNKCSCALTPHICPQGVERENLTFLLPFYVYVPCCGFCLGRFSTWKYFLTIWETFAMQ